MYFFSRIFQSSSSSDSDFNDFHYLNQYLDEFYNSDNDDDNHLIVRKSSSSEGTNLKNSVHPNTLGQGDVIEETIEPSLATAIEKQEYQYSIYELLNRYENESIKISSAYFCFVLDIEILVVI